MPSYDDDFVVHSDPTWRVPQAGVSFAEKSAPKVEPVKPTAADIFEFAEKYFDKNTAIGNPYAEGQRVALRNICEKVAQNPCIVINQWAQPHIDYALEQFRERSVAADAALDGFGAGKLTSVSCALDQA